MFGDRLLSPLDQTSEKIAPQGQYDPAAGKESRIHKPLSDHQHIKSSVWQTIEQQRSVVHMLLLSPCHTVWLNSNPPSPRPNIQQQLQCNYDGFINIRNTMLGSSASEIPQWVHQHQKYHCGFISIRNTMVASSASEIPQQIHQHQKYHNGFTGIRNTKI